MCVNDLIVAGGEPLFFLDYYATGKLTIEEAATVVESIAEGKHNSIDSVTAMIVCSPVLRITVPTVIASTLIVLSWMAIAKHYHCHCHP
jgi:hypothetical protein